MRRKKNFCDEDPQFDYEEEEWDYDDECDNEDD